MVTTGLATIPEHYIPSICMVKAKVKAGERYLVCFSNPACEGFTFRVVITCRVRVREVATRPSWIYICPVKTLVYSHLQMVYATDLNCRPVSLTSELSWPYSAPANTCGAPSSNIWPKFLGLENNLAPLSSQACNLHGWQTRTFKGLP